MRKQAKSSPWLEQVVKQFIKVTRSYWPGLFHCYDVVELPRTNNDLEVRFVDPKPGSKRAWGMGPKPTGGNPRWLENLVPV